MSGIVSNAARRKLAEFVSILDQAGVADNATSNTAALQALVNAGHKHIRFPQSGNGTYLFGGDLPTGLTANLAFDVDPGVTISVLDIGYLDPSLVFVRDTKLYLSALKAVYMVGPTTNRVPSSRNIFPGYADRDTATIKPVTCTTDLTCKKVTYNTDVFSVVAPAASSVSGITLNTTDANDYLAAYKKLKPGDEITAQFTAANGGATPIAIVRTATSYYGLAANTGDAAQPALFSKASGAAPSASNITYLGMGTHASYAAYKSLWTIRINSLTNFSVLFNGAEVQQVETNDEIIEAGFGGQGPAGGAITMQDWTWTQGRAQAGKKALSIAVFGDSISDHALYGNWPQQLVDMLDQHYGLRVLYLDNYAHSGDNSTAQMALCTGANIARADVVLIMIGVNDIQGAVTEATYAANLTSMINTCAGAGKRVIVGTPTMFYGQGQAGAGVGQNSSNYDLGKGVRAKCLRVCADLGVKNVDTLAQMGPILADWVNPELSTVANLGRDPVVFDNIHPTLLGRTLLARAFAAAIAGQVEPVPTLKKESTALPAANLAGGWTFTSQAGQWARDEVGNVQLSGIIDKGASVADGTVIYTMPENVRPVKTVRATTWCDSGIGRIQIDAATGQVSIYGFPVGGLWASLDNISFATR